MSIKDYRLKNSLINVHYSNFNDIIQREFSLDEIKIFHYAWWKPSGNYFKKWGEIAELFLEVSGKYVPE
jgi:hypothetical protein